MLAHEIKNPLSGIRGAAQLLRTSIAGKDVELVDLITRETDRIVKLLDRMEVFSDETPVNRQPGQHAFSAGNGKAFCRIRLRKRR